MGIEASIRNIQDQLTQLESVYPNNPIQADDAIKALQPITRQVCVILGIIRPTLNTMDNAFAMQSLINRIDVLRNRFTAETTIGIANARIMRVQV